MSAKGYLCIKYEVVRVKASGLPVRQFSSSTNCARAVISQQANKALFIGRCWPLPKFHFRGEGSQKATKFFLSVPNRSLIDVTGSVAGGCVNVGGHSWTWGVPAKRI